MVKVKELAKNFVWDQSHAPVEITATGKKLPLWKLGEDGILHQPVNERSGIFQGKAAQKTTRLTLIPYGFTKLRIVAFPVVK